MTISLGSPIDRTDEIRTPMAGRTIPLAERMRTAVSEAPSEEELDPSEIMKKAIFEFVLAQFKERLLHGDEEETGNVRLEVGF